MATAFSTTLVPDWSVSPVCAKTGPIRKIKNQKYNGDLAQRHAVELEYKPERKPKLAEFLRHEIVQEEFENIKKRNGWI